MINRKMPERIVNTNGAAIHVADIGFVAIDFGSPVKGGAMHRIGGDLE